MDLRVVAGVGGHRLSGDDGDPGLVNAFLAHLSVRNFSPATRRAYAYDLLNFLRFLTGRGSHSVWWVRWTCSYYLGCVNSKWPHHDGLIWPHLACWRG